MPTLRDCERCLCVASHPDDEVLGAGATMAALVDQGCDVHALVLGEGVGSRYERNQRPDEEVASLAEQLRAAGRILGIETTQLDLPDNRFDTVPMLDIVKRIERVASEIKPDLVLTHHAGDLNVDHRLTANAVLTAFRPVPGANAQTLLAFETLSSTEWNAPANGGPFIPTWFEDASVGLERKVEAMAAYAHEACEWPHPRSSEGIRAAARRWGSQVGFDAAEPFALLRHVGG